MPAGFPAGVIFDMDGLLLDSERLARDAFLQACADLGWQADLEVYQRCIGTTPEGTEAILREHFGAGFPYPRLEQHWQLHYRALLDGGPVPVKPGAGELLEHLARTGVPRALATSTGRALAEHKLSRAGLLEFFQLTVCGGESARGKPHPEPYLNAAAGLGLAPAQCLALEDSANGVRAAHAAGCVVVQVPDLIAADADTRALAHLVVGSLADVLSLLKQNC